MARIEIIGPHVKPPNQENRFRERVNIAYMTLIGQGEVVFETGLNM